MKRRTLVLFAVSCFSVTVAIPQVNAPKVGTARYPDSAVREVYGLDCSFVVARPVLASADTISFSDSGGLLSANGRITLVDSAFSVVAEFESGEQHPLINMDGGPLSAVAWLPEHQALLHWTGESFVLKKINGAVLNEVTSVQTESPRIAKLLFSDRDAVFQATISLENGDLISVTLLPGIKGPAYQEGPFVIFHDKNGLEIESPGGALKTIALPASDLAFERMSRDWVHLISPVTNQNWALHLNSHIAQLAEMPAIPASKRDTEAGK